MKAAKLLTLLFLLGCSLDFVSAQPGQQHRFEHAEAVNVVPKVEWFSVNEPNVHELSIWGGYAFDSFKLWGKTADATLGQFGLGYNRRLVRIGEQLVEYRFELNMYSRITYPEFQPGRERTSVSGYGIVPLGLRINFRQSRQLQPFIGSSGGFIYLNDPFPDERGKNFNYTFTTGLGLELMLSPNSSLSLGYKYYHISNGESGEVNPGVDSGFFFGSFTLF